jgi:hypothetical protein
MTNAMNETQILAKIQEIVSLQDRIKAIANNTFSDFKTQWRLNDIRHKLIANLKSNKTYVNSKNKAVTNFKLMLLALELFDGETQTYETCLQDLKTALENGTN